MKVATPIQSRGSAAAQPYRHHQRTQRSVSHFAGWCYRRCLEFTVSDCVCDRSGAGTGKRFDWHCRQRTHLFCDQRWPRHASFAVDAKVRYRLSWSRAIRFMPPQQSGKTFRFGRETVAEGSYESPVRDAKLTATWGRIWWRGAGTVELQTRSGNGERPDATWSEWSTAYRNADGTQVTSPRARFIQWRATLRSAVPAWQRGWKTLALAYLPRNVAPEVLSVSFLAVRSWLAAGRPNSGDPNIESSGLDPSLFGAVAQVPPRRIFQRGARSFQWQAEDRNGDTLEYAIYYRALTKRRFGC